METSAITPSAVTAAQNAAAATTTQAPSVGTSDFETFIKLLTTQIQNQDPLNPIESADFAVQLATFSTVEQQVQTNDILTSLGDRIGGLGVAQLSSWIGLDARAVVPVQFDGAPVTVTVQAAAQADAAELVVHDSDGNEVQRIAVPAESGPLEWAGVAANGAPLPPGAYTLSLASYEDGTLISTQQAAAHGRIVEARSENGETILVMAGGQEVAATDILGLREPES